MQYPAQAAEGGAALVRWLMNLTSICKEARQLAPSMCASRPALKPGCSQDVLAVPCAALHSTRQLMESSLF